MRDDLFGVVYASVCGLDLLGKLEMKIKQRELLGAHPHPG